MVKSTRSHFDKDVRRPPSAPRPTIGWIKPAVLVVIVLSCVGLLAYAADHAIKTYHDAVSLSGKVSDPTPTSLVIAGEPLSIPANMIRSAGMRAGGNVDRVDLLLHWPSLEGFSDDKADAFRDGSTDAPLLYVSIVPRENPLDSDMRLSALYSRFFIGGALAGPAGLTGRYMTDDSGYRGELIFFAADGPDRYAARCIAEATPEVPATCIRDVNIGNQITMTYRFDRSYLGDWKAMDNGLKTLATDFVGLR